MKKLKVLCTGSFDCLHSGHITFLKNASAFGLVSVGIGSDFSIEKYKGKKPVCNEQERLFMLRAIRYVDNAFINSGEGHFDFKEDLHNFDMLIVNEDQHSEVKENYCFDLGIKYIVLKRDTIEGLPVRSTTNYRQYASNDSNGGEPWYWQSHS